MILTDVVHVLSRYRNCGSTTALASIIESRNSEIFSINEKPILVVGNSTNSKNICEKFNICETDVYIISEIKDLMVTNRPVLFDISAINVLLSTCITENEKLKMQLSSIQKALNSINKMI